MENSSIFIQNKPEYFYALEIVMYGAYPSNNFQVASRISKLNRFFHALAEKESDLQANYWKKLVLGDFSYKKIDENETINWKKLYCCDFSIELNGWIKIATKSDESAKIEIENSLKPYVECFKVSSNSKVQYLMGLCLGRTFCESSKEAFNYFKLSADQKFAPALLKVGLCYALGNGITKNSEEAFKYYLLSANQGNANAQQLVADCYFKGLGVAKDETKAFEYYLLSADQGNAIAQWNVGDYYLKGLVTEKDEAKALKYYLLSANQGNVTAKHKVGDCYFYGNGVLKDEAEAFEYYYQASEGGYSPAQEKLKISYKIQESDIYYFKNLLFSADEGDALNQWKIGECYRFGRGVLKNPLKAFKYYQLSANQKNFTALFKLGQCYEDGIGVAKDVEKANECYKQAANLGHMGAVEYLKKVGIIPRF